MKKIRNNRNPRYQESLNLANIDSSVTRIAANLNKLVESIIPRNYTVTDAYIKLAGRYSEMVNLVRTREDRIDLLERELKNCDPDHWLIAEEDSEDNAEEAEDETEPEQQEFDFGEVIKRRPN